LSAPVDAFTVKLNAAVALLGTASVTRTVKELVASTVGVPEITPVELFRVSPVGNVPTVTVQEPYGGVPPVAAKVTE